jgi:dihydrofolate synthase/folylpolyglutamate synthase
MFQRIGAAALKFNLDNITSLMDTLDDPHREIKTIHVAGTNGKGSSSHMIASILQSAGYKTGLFTSPHLESFTERIKIDGKEISENAVIEFVELIKDTIKDIKPSFFEITFAMAMHYFNQQKVDVAVIEVGMGGRLDSTNIIDPEICLITNISLDHQYFLGNTLPDIAKEKAGIIKEGIPVIISESQNETEKVFKSIAKKLNSDIIFADKQFYSEQASDKRYNIINREGVFLEGLKPDLKGEFQLGNILGVVTLLTRLNELETFVITEENIREGLENVANNTGIKGRWQVLSEAPLIITDTGHNNAGTQVILNEIKKMEFNNLHIVWGMVSDKDANDILGLLPKSAKYYFVEPDIPRSMPLDDLLEAADKIGIKGQGYHSVMDGYEAAKISASDDDLIFIGGSTFVVAEVENL